MEIEYLKTFLTVAKVKHFSLAAQELYISQSSLSKQIKYLERELKVSLFDRTTRSVELTPAGEELKIHAKEILKSYDKLQDRMNFHSSTNEIVISMGCIPVATQYRIPIFLSYFQKKHPNIKIRLLEKDSTTIVKLLNESKLHTALTISNSLDNKLFKNNKLFRTYPLVFDELCLVVSKNNPLSKKRIIDISEAANEEFLLLGNSCVYDTTLQMFINAGFLPNINIDNSRLETVVSLVSANLGVSLITKKIINYFRDENLKVIRLKNSPVITTVLVINDAKGNSKELELLKDLALEWFQTVR